MALWLFSTGASPQVVLPSLPSLPVPGALNGIGPGFQTGADLVDHVAQSLVDARLIAAANLIRNNRATLEADPDGAPIVRAEVLAYSPSGTALQQALAAGFEVLRRRTLESLDAEIVVLRSPIGLSTRHALQRLRTQDPTGNYDYNHIYMGSGSADADGWPPTRTIADAAPGDNERFAMGLIDGGVNTQHPALRNVRVARSGCNGTMVVSAHGTAIASLLVGEAPNFHGAKPGASLLAVDAFCGLATGGAVDAVADALALLSQKRVRIVNVSLVGPANRLLAQVVMAAQARGMLIIAAVGNDGPSAPPLYPAAYPGVVAVTAVDRRLQVLPEACRGAHVQFAAPGTELIAANGWGDYAPVRGTSFAAPIVAGLLSLLMDGVGQDTTRALQQLRLRAHDLGKPGRDPVYGFGSVGDELLHNQPNASASE